jgi:methyl-accepting chemotaxis protein
MKKNKGLPLAVKIVGITSMLVIVVLTILIILTATSSKKHVYQSEENNLALTTDIAEDLLSAEIKGLNYQLSLSSHDDGMLQDLSNSNSKNLLNYLKETYNSGEFFSSVFISNSNGVITETYPNNKYKGIEMKNVAQWEGILEYVRANRETMSLDKNNKPIFPGNYTTNIYKGLDNNPVISISTGCFLGDEFLGIITYEVDAIKLYERYISDKVFGLRGYGVILDTNGNFVTHINTSLNLTDGNSHNFMQESLRLIKSGKSKGMVYYPWEGENKILVYNTIDYTNWFLAFTVYEADLTILSNTLTTNMILIGLISLISLILALIAVTVIFVSKPINKVVVTLTDGAQNLESASQQIAASSQQLSSGNSELAASIEEITSSLEELQSVIELNTKNINESELLMKETNNNSQKVSQDMGNLSQALEEISSNSQEIVNIISVIEDIAFQTNILALNAAVEAGRAGEAGSGFAVVADQVKELAQKSSESSKLTAKLIKNALLSIEKGQGIGKSVKDAQDKTSSMSSNVTTLLNEVNRASKEQMKGVNQITQAITQTNSVVQQTAASAEETASASEELLGQSEDVNMVVDSLNMVVKGRVVERKKITRTNHEKKQVPSGKTKAASTGKPRANSTFNPDEIIPMDDDFKDF